MSKANLPLIAAMLDKCERTPQQGPVDPAQFPDGIVWNEPFIGEDGALDYETHHIAAEDWNRDHAWSPAEVASFRALSEAMKAKPFTFVPDELLRQAFAEGNHASAVFKELASRSTIDLNYCLDALKDVPAPMWARRKLRHGLRLLATELTIQREGNFALRHRVAELEDELKAARSRPREST
jgi:hypothetical protein